jgi:uncharacterized protein
VTTATVRASLCNAAAELGAAAWNACANPGGSRDPHPFTRFEFFSALEESGSAAPETGWQPSHLTLSRENRIEALLPLYLKNHSRGEYVFDHGWADAFERAGGCYYPKLQASVPFTPVRGPRLLVAEGGDESALRRMLLETGKNVAQKLGASSLHITFMTDEEWAVTASCGFLQRTDRQFHWTNEGYSSFDEFLDELSSAKRKNLRKERLSIRNAGIAFDRLTGNEITESHWDSFFRLYTATGSRKWGDPYLTREFFSRIGERMGESVVLILARRGPRTIAGALNFRGGNVLFGRNWGSSEFVPFLHFETCYYQAIDFAIEHGLKRVEAGAQGEHKLLRGYRPVMTHSAHYIVHPGLRDAVARYLTREREAVAHEIAELGELAPFRKEG